MLSACVCLTECLPLPAALEHEFNLAGFQILKRIDDVSAKTLDINFSENAKLTVIFAVDVMPLPSLSDTVQNPRIFEAHKRLRKLLNRGSNLAFSLNENIAWELCGKFLSDAEYNNILLHYKNLIAEYKTDAEVIEVMVNGNRGKVEKIQIKNKIMIQKTYRDSQPLLLEREINARRALADIKEISEISEVGKRHFIMPFYKNKYEWNETTIHPFSHYRAQLIFNVVKQIWDSGWVLLDCHPGNFIFESNNKFKVVDFEYAVKHENPALPFEKSWYITGVPDAISDNMPMSPKLLYNKIWLPAVGLKYTDIINVSPSAGVLRRQYAKRLIFMPRIWYQKFRRSIFYPYRRQRIYSDSNFIYLPLRKRYR